MTKRCMIHVGGPTGGGKSAFAEALLESTDEWLLAARCVRDDSLEKLEESVPEDDRELERYRRAGASGAARIRFPATHQAVDEFFLTDLMEDPSDVVVMEGDCPLPWPDLRVFVAAAPPVGSRLFVRRKRNLAREEREKARRLERVLHNPEAMLAFVEEEVGIQFAHLARSRPELLDQLRRVLHQGLEKARHAPPPEPIQNWAVNARYAGIERGELVVITVRSDEERGRADGLVDQLRRLRTEDELFHDILGRGGKRTPVTAVAADLRDPTDPGRKKAMTRVRRAIRASSG